jgi:WD40 repeat protein
MNCMYFLMLDELIEPECKLMLKHDFDIVDLVWNKDNQKILTCSLDKNVILWDT